MTIPEYKEIIKKNRKTVIAAVAAFLFLTAGIVFISYQKKTRADKLKAAEKLPVFAKVPDSIRGIHLTSWVAGLSSYRKKLEGYFTAGKINCVVIAIKEYHGEVYIDGVKDVARYKTYVNAAPDLENFVRELKKKGIYVVARVVIFKDNMLAKQRPDLAVKTQSGEAWRDKKGNRWTDPYNREVWEYNIKICERAADIGFDEIQYDYIRFPSDGNIRLCRYSVPHSSGSADAALASFLKYSGERLKKKGVYTSACLFGLTTSVDHNMGIGQRIEEMTAYVDFVSPMVYPSHYGSGEYGYRNPEAAPYEIVFKSIEHGVKRLGEKKVKLRPYLQDFSLAVKYDEEKVREQIRACYDNGVDSWLLWNPQCKYTISAVYPPPAGIEEKGNLPAVNKAGTPKRTKN